jgi:hypothetical protein
MSSDIIWFVRLVVSALSVCVAAVSIVMVSLHLLRVFRRIHDTVPTIAYVFGPFLLSERYIGEEGKLSLRKFWKWTRALMISLVVLAVTYPFP